jgi:hypothetical protein
VVIFFFEKKIYRSGQASPFIGHHSTPRIGVQGITFEMLFKEFDHLLVLFSQIHSKQTFIMKRKKDGYLLFGFSLFFLFFSPGLLETGSIP